MRRAVSPSTGPSPPVALLVASALLFGCSDGALDPVPPGSQTCVLATTGIALHAEPIELLRLDPAIADAASRSSIALGDSEADIQLRTALDELRATSGNAADAVLCAAFNNVADGLAAWDARHGDGHPGRPDFSLIRLTLSIYEESVRADHMSP